jgi:hypothetical protein
MGVGEVGALTLLEDYYKSKLAGQMVMSHVPCISLQA